LNAHEYLIKTAQESLEVRNAFVKECGEAMVRAAQAMGDCIREGGKILILGNGGSAADAQHMAAEMVGRMMLERPPLPAIALTTDTSNLTAIGNDYGYDFIFVKQVEALAKKGDVIIAISTSGNSRNVVHAVEAARTLGCQVISLTGGTGGKLKGLSDICLNASLGTNSSRIQESHSFAVHTMVDLLDRYYLPSHLSPKGIK
jgi:D-sedoheptulose 7-phosphate isomerase